MKKKLARARRAKPGKARHAAPAPAPAAAPPLSPEAPDAAGDDGALSIDSMLRAQLVETHLAAMDCLRRARSGESPELRDRALTHATRLLSLFGRQVTALERRRPPPATTAKQASASDTADWSLADAAATALADLAAEIAADDPPDGTDPLPGGGESPAWHDGAGDGAGGGP